MFEPGLPNVPVSYEFTKNRSLVRKAGTTIQNLVRDSENKEPHQYVFTGFTHYNQPQQPAELTYQAATHDYPMVDYVHFVFHINNQKSNQSSIAAELTELHDKVKDLINTISGEYQKPDAIFYADNNHYWHLLIQLTTLVPSFLFDAIRNNITKNYPLNNYELIKTTSMSEAIPAINKANSGGYYIEELDGCAIQIKTIWREDVEQKSHEKINMSPVVYTEDQLVKAINSYVEDTENIADFRNDEYRPDLWESVLVNTHNYEWRVDVLDYFVSKMSKEKGIDKDAMEQEVYEARKRLAASEQKQSHVKPLSDYLPLYRTVDGDNHKVGFHNLAEQLISLLGDSFIGDPKMSVFDAADMIKEHYTPALIKQGGNNRESVVIFNPLTGLWTHDDDIFSMLLNVVKPYRTDNDFNRMMQGFADYAASANRYIEPYHGSRYILFNNGCLDVTALKLYPLDSTLVHELHFTNRNHIDLDWIENPKLPVIKDGRIKHLGDWDPNSFITAYANNNEEQLRYLLFGLSLGLFGGHNFGVHFDIQGQSRWGKSTLSEIFKNLYGSKQVHQMSYPTLNEKFPFNNYSLDTSVIWISEANLGTEPLNDSNGTLVYDKLADNEIDFEIKGKPNLTVTNPPQVFIDGTQLIQANNLSTGPAGRTLAYKLPPMTQALQDQAYGNDINHFLSRPEVLQWLVWKMIEAYRKTVPDYKQKSLQMNLNVSENLDMLPEIATKWRDDLVSNNSALTPWFENYIYPYLTDTDNPDDPNATIMHNQFLYNTLYDVYYDEMNPHDTYHRNEMEFDKFNREINQLIEQEGWRRIPIGSTSGREKHPRKKVSNYRNMNFDWDRYEDDNRPLKALQDANNLPKPLKTKREGWYKLIKNPKVEN